MIKTPLINILSRRRCKQLKIARLFATSRADEQDFSRAVDEFRQNGVTILPLKVDQQFVRDSKQLCLGAWEDARWELNVFYNNIIEERVEYG